MVNYACGFNQSETGKYFEWIIIMVNTRFGLLVFERGNELVVQEIGSSVLSNITVFFLILSGLDKVVLFEAAWTLAWTLSISPFWLLGVMDVGLKILSTSIVVTSLELLSLSWASICWKRLPHLVQQWRAHHLKYSYIVFQLFICMLTTRFPCNAIFLLRASFSSFAKLSPAS